MSPFAWFMIGLATGVGLSLPFVAWLIRRAARRARALEQRARSAERLAELGTLTGGLAHEIKNPLSTIGLNLQLLRETVDDAELAEAPAGRLRRRIDALSAEAERLRGILEDFLRFAGRMELERETVDLNALVDELVDFYAPQAEQSGVHMRTQLAPGPIEAFVDHALLKQAMLNLLINATQAMVQARYADAPHGGATDLIVRTETDRDAIRLHVTDTGPGIDDERLARIFDPYFSTKKGGTGLGLPTTRRIVQEHGGRIDVHTELGKGTDFAVTLPVDQPPAA